MKLEILTICEAAENKGKLSLIGIGDIFHSHQEPVKIPKCCIVFRIRYGLDEAGKHTTKLSIVDQDGRLLGRPMIDTKDIQLREGSPGCVDTGILRADGITFPSFGDYSIELEVDGKPLASQPLYLLRAQ